jgi:hypothetical protein
MRKIILFTLTFVCIFSINAQNMFQYKISKPYALLNFIETIADGSRHSKTLKEHIQKTIPTSNTEFYVEIEKFKNIRLDYSFLRDQLPEKRRQSRTTLDLIYIAAVQSNDLREFKVKMAGIISNEDHTKLFDVFTKIEPFYNASVWNDSYKKLKKQQKKLEKFEAQSNAFFNQFKNFYNSAWADDMAFTVALFPIPGKRGNTTATPYANSLCVGILTEEVDVEVRLGVVLHEMCHVLYDEQSASFQHELDSMFAKNKSIYTKHANSYFDEGLATAIGNGYTSFKLKNKYDESEWYNNEYINGFAKGLYPLVSRYLDQNRRIDQAFVDSSIIIFEQKFPNLRTILEYCLCVFPFIMILKQIKNVKKCPVLSNKNFKCIRS